MPDIDGVRVPDLALPAKPVGMWRSVGHGALGVAKSYLTAPDGSSFAPGRLFAFATFIVAQCLVIRASHAMLPKLDEPEKWGAFFLAVGAFQAGTGGTCIALVLGIAPSDSGGKWWGKEASPPPPPGSC